MQAARLASRLQRELRMLQTDPPPGVCAWPCNDTLSHLEAQIQGPEATVYAKGIFTLEVRVPERYPFEPPNVKFRTPIYHPNIDSGGRICLDILNMPPKGAWKPSLNIPAILASIGLLLAEPNPDDGLMGDITAEYKHDRESFDAKAQKWTAQYAVQSPLEDGAPYTRSNIQSDVVEPKAHPIQPIGKAPHSLQIQDAGSSLGSSEERRRIVLRDVSNAVAEKEQCASKLDHFRGPGPLNLQKPNLSIRLRKGGGKGSEGEKPEDTAGGAGDADSPQSRVLESSGAAHPGAHRGQDKLPDGLTSIAEDVRSRTSTSEAEDFSEPSSLPGAAASMKEGSPINSTGVCPLSARGTESQGPCHSSKRCATASVDLNKLKRPRESKTIAPCQISDHSPQLPSMSEIDSGGSGSQGTTKGTLGNAPRELVDSVDAPAKVKSDVPQTNVRHPRENSEPLREQQGLTSQSEKQFSNLGQRIGGETSSQSAVESVFKTQGSNTSRREGSVAIPVAAEDLRLPIGQKWENRAPVFQIGTTVTNSKSTEAQTCSGPRINISGESNSCPTESQERPNHYNAKLSDVKKTSISSRATSGPVHPSAASEHGMASIQATAEPFSRPRQSEATSMGTGSRVERKKKAEQINTEALIVLDSESDEEPPKGRSRLSLACRKSKKRK